MICGSVESKFLHPNIKNHLDFLEEQIATSPDGGDYMCGKQLTGADFLLSFPLGAARGRTSFSKESQPKLWAYVERLEALDGYKRAVQKIVDIDGHYDSSL